MRRRFLTLAVVSSWLLVLWLSSWKVPGYTRIELREAETGSQLALFVLRDGEAAVLRWRNSLFGLDVTEIFTAESGVLVQKEVTFADPGVTPPPRVSARDVGDLYHTGGAFSASGLNRPFTRVVYRVGEIGEPKLTVREHVVDFKREVGFGGRVVLTTSVPTLFEGLWGMIRTR
jgi:hypothetical protein